jgi:hypothetical protein
MMNFIMEEPVGRSKTKVHLLSQFSDRHFTVI